MSVFVTAVSAMSTLTIADTDGALATQVERAAAAQARQFVAPPDRFEVLTARFGSSDAFVSGPVELELLELSGPNQSGIVRVSFIVRQSGIPQGTARATVRGTVRGPVLVAARTLGRDTLLTAEDVRIEDSDLTRLLGEPLRDPTELVGNSPRRILSRGRVIEHELLRSTPVVRRGQVVDLVFRHASLTVIVRGQALGEAAPGETLDARNVETGVRVRGEAQADGTVRVFTRSFRPSARTAR